MIVYRIKFPNEKVYIGITSRGLEQRMYEHKSRARTGRKTKLYSAMKKYENFEVEIIEKCETYAQAKEREIFYISYYNSNGSNGYNLIDGGDGSCGYKISEETRQKLIKAHTGVPLSKEHRMSLSRSKKGVKRGADFSRKMSEVLRGKKRSLESINRLKNTLSKPFNVYIKETDEFVGHWKNVSDCANDLHINRNSIHNFFAGLTKCVAKKYIFRRT